jgi:hypothetical protein
MRFARALRGDSDGLKLAWLAGVLEAEGTFLRATPSTGLPAIACQMTDADIVQRVAGAFGTAVHATYPRGSRRPAYITRVRGSRAAHLMNRLTPGMSGRRRRAIAAATDGYSPHRRKLDFAAAEEIRDLRAEGASVSFLAEAFAVSRPTIRQVLERSIYGSRHDLPNGSEWTAWQPGVAQVLGVSLIELCWLAGWLEGEGSFVPPPPSDPKRARISAVTCDADVAIEVGRLLRVRPCLSYSPRQARTGRSPIWRLLRRGRQAVELMTGLRPLMGERRKAQIDRALRAVDFC